MNEKNDKKTQQTCWISKKKVVCFFCQGIQETNLIDNSYMCMVLSWVENPECLLNAFDKDKVTHATQYLTRVDKENPDLLNKWQLFLSFWRAFIKAQKTQAAISVWWLVGM